MGELAYLDLLGGENKAMSNRKSQLRKLLTERSFKYSNEPIFPLASGRMSQFYVDCKMTTMNSKGSVLIGNLVYGLVESLSIKGIGGLTLGADPIANATALIAGLKDVELNSFSIRKEPKKHGLKKWIEGEINPKDRVVIIDDVITTGGSALKAIDRAIEYGLEIVAVVVLVDREEGGKQNIEKRGFSVKALFTKSDLMEEYEGLHNQGL
jgi:orotate phosphoribosyltransferase